MSEPLEAACAEGCAVELDHAVKLVGCYSSRTLSRSADSAIGAEGSQVICSLSASRRVPSHTPADIRRSVPHGARGSLRANMCKIAATSALHCLVRSRLIIGQLTFYNSLLLFACHRAEGPRAIHEGRSTQGSTPAKCAARAGCHCEFRMPELRPCEGGAGLPEKRLIEVCDPPDEPGKCPRHMPREGTPCDVPSVQSCEYRRACCSGGSEATSFRCNDGRWGARLNPKHECPPMP